MTQGIHRLVSNNMVMASDIWVSTNAEIPIMKSNLYGLALNCNLPLGFDLAIEGYYKTLSNVLEYRNAASYTQSQSRFTPTRSATTSSCLARITSM